MRNACVTAQSAPSNSDRFSAHFSRSEVNTVRYWVRVKAGLAWPSCLLTASTGTPPRRASVGVWQAVARQLAHPGRHAAARHVPLQVAWQQSVAERIHEHPPAVASGPPALVVPAVPAHRAVQRRLVQGLLGQHPAQQRHRVRGEVDRPAGVAGLG